MVHKPKIYFITGVCGAGKTTVIPHLKSLLSYKDYDIHDFDERGVPNKSDTKWRIEETKYWIDIGEKNLENGVSTIICGFSNPKEAVHSDNDNIEFILLDADNKTIKQRISGRYQTEKSKQELLRVTGDGVEKFIKDNTSFLETLKNICEKDKRCNIVDTTSKTPKEVTKQLVKIIKK